MTYCLAIVVKEGLVMASDSRTNSGVDQLNVYSKMHQLVCTADRMLTMVSAGNLATSQAVVRRLRSDIQSNAPANLNTVATVAEAAEYIGAINFAETQKYVAPGKASFIPDASFILGGCISGSPYQIYMIYPEGNYIRAANRSPFLQIGELKYGKPILDRIVEPSLPLQQAIKCALVSMDSTMRSNAAVGPPIEMIIAETGRPKSMRSIVFDEEGGYLSELRTAWQANLREAFENLPALPQAKPTIRLIDAADD
jgi:putative proteasome-type protease